MTHVDMNLLARQLSQLGRDLDEEITILGKMEDAAVTAEGSFRHHKELHEDALAVALLKSRLGSAEARKAEARLACIPERREMEQANLDWDKKRAALRTQYQNIKALHDRIEIGRSLLSREKSLLSLEMSGVS